MKLSPFTTRHVSQRSDSERSVTGRPDSSWPAAGRRALVLGGGGAAGNAWLIGVVAGLYDGGLDVTSADLLVGTSAGATAAAQLTCSPPPELYASILAAVPPQRGGHSGGTGAGAGTGTGDGGGARGGGGGGGGARGSRADGSDTGRPAAVHGPLGSMVDHLKRTNDVIAAADGPLDVRRRLGASALELPDAFDLARQAQWRETVAARFACHDWPRQALLITAVDARTGDPVVFDRHSGVDLVDAVAASTSGGAPYAIGDAVYIDGGYRRSSENADLAAGYERVLVLSPFGGRTRMPLEWNMNLAPQLDELRAGASEVESVFPDQAALDAFGGNMMNLAARPPAARAGYAQGLARAAELMGFWS